MNATDVSEVLFCLVPEKVAPSKAESASFVERAHVFIDWCALKLKWTLVPLAALGTIASTVLGIIASATWPKDGKFSWLTFWLIVFVAIALASSIVITTLVDVSRRGQESGQIKAKVSAQHELREAVLPTLRSLSKLTVLPQSKRTVQFAKAVSQVLMARPTLFPGKEEVRIVVYGLDWSDTGKRLLVPLDHSGRAQDIPAPFDSSQPGRGVKAFGWLFGDSPKTRYVANYLEEPDPDWGGTGAGYKTYISAPILAAGAPYGMLTVDSPNIDDISESNIPMVEVLAHILGTAFALPRD